MRKIEKYIHTNPFEFKNQKQNADPSAVFQPNQFPPDNLSQHLY